MSEKLFSYGTLQLEAVQLSTFHRLLTGHQDAITGYTLTQIEIIDPHVIATSGLTQHPMIQFSGNAADEVPGTVFDITHDELLQADAYEVDDYVRVLAPLKSGGNAWVYVERAGKP